MTNETPQPQNPLIRVVQAASAFRHSNEVARRMNVPTHPNRYRELCDALDALALSGAEAEIAKMVDAA